MATLKNFEENNKKVSLLLMKIVGKCRKIN
jgi:hypothetical protein